MDKNKATAAVVLICVSVLLCGLILGYAWGGSLVHNKWIEWNDEREEYINEYCTCLAPSTEAYYNKIHIDPNIIKE